MKILRFFMIMCLVALNITSYAQLPVVTREDSLAYPHRWEFDFVVPDSGSFSNAIRCANERVDKDKRYRIFIKSNYYTVKGDGDTIFNVEKGDTVYFPSPITKLTACNTSIIGEGWKDTKIINIPVHEGIGITSTLYLDRADSTYIQDVELWCNFKNDVNAFANRAVALNEKNCKGNIFKNMSLLSTQDTYYTNNGGSTYLENCRINGTVDFICGGGNIYFNNCDIILRPRGKTGSRDVICAPATSEKEWGYVFNNCTISGSPEQQDRFHLARPWRNAPKAVFINTEMAMNPAKEGYCEMHGTIPGLFAEYRSHTPQGNLIDLSNRKRQFKNKEDKLVDVAYNTELTDTEANSFSLDKMFGVWEPQQACKTIAPPVLKMKGRRTIVWKDIPEAYCYAICIDGDVVAFTRAPRYEVPAETEEGACFSVRCANWYGGLGDKSNEVVYPNR